MLDIRHWEGESPLGDDRDEGGWVQSPDRVAKIEQARRLALTKGDLGPSVPADLFVWAEGMDQKKPWLTRIGGKPWREKGKSWPKDPKGVPLVFLGQICFVDSQDILPCKLPGDVALIFGTATKGWISITEGSALEWSPLKIKEPEDGFGSIPWTGELAFEYQGVLHRTVQYTDWKVAETPFNAVGYKEGGWGIRSVQATSIGTYANLPQGWPFKKEDGRNGSTLIATLSSFYFRGKWPLCNVPRAIMGVRADGSEYELFTDALDFGIGDAGCIWIYRDEKGSFKLDDACG